MDEETEAWEEIKYIACGGIGSEPGFKAKSNLFHTFTLILEVRGTLKIGYLHELH